MAWIGPAIGLASNALFSDSTPSGGGAATGGGGSWLGGGASTQPQYVPVGLSQADQGWLNSFDASQNIASSTRNAASPYYTQSLYDSANINYSPYIQGAQQAGQAYGRAGDLAAGQVAGYGQAAQQAMGQQQDLYGLGQRVANTAFDPQNELYDRTRQQFTDQVRAGQAARGLGNSQAGAMMESGALGNFNIDWQNNQLQRQAAGLAADVNASNAGIAQGRLYGANQSAALGAQGAAGGYYNQAAQIPLMAQQYAAAGPGNAAAAYAQQQAGLQGLFGTAQQGAQGYLQLGQNAQQGNYGNTTAANAAQAQGLAQLGNAIGPTVSGWFGNSGSTSGLGSEPYPGYYASIGLKGGSAPTTISGEPYPGYYASIGGA